MIHLYYVLLQTRWGGGKKSETDQMLKSFWQQWNWKNRNLRVYSYLNMWKIWLKVVNVHVPPCIDHKYKNVEKVCSIINKGSFWIASRLGLSHGTDQWILTEDLNMWHISAKSVPWLLIYKQKQWCVFVCQED